MKNLSTQTVLDLLEKYKDDSDIVDMIQDTINSCAEYTNAVVKHVTASNVNYFAPTQERATHMVNFDRSRRLAHEALISSVVSLNRFLRMEGMELFYDGDESDRYEIADFAIVVTELVAKEEIAKYRNTLRENN